MVCYFSFSREEVYIVFFFSYSPCLLHTRKDNLVPSIQSCQSRMSHVYPIGKTSIHSYQWREPLIAQLDKISCACFFFSEFGYTMMLWVPFCIWESIPDLQWEKHALRLFSLSLTLDKIFNLFPTFYVFYKSDFIFHRKGE